MGQTIKNVEQGKAPSLMDTDKANEVIDALNALLTMVLQPMGTGKVVVSKGGVTIDLNDVMNRVKKIETRLDSVSAVATCASGGTVNVTVTV